MAGNSAFARIVWYSAGSGGRDPRHSRSVVLGAAVTIGRDAHADIRLNDPQVSRLHTKVLVTPAALRVTDLNSGNGTWIDGERVQSASWLAGQPLKIGSYIFTYDVAYDAVDAENGGASMAPVAEADLPGGRPIPIWAFVAAFLVLSFAASVAIWQMAPSGPLAVASTQAKASAPLPYADALAKAVDGVLQFQDKSRKAVLTIDPLIHGGSGGQTVATQATGGQITELIKGKFPGVEVMPFKASAIAALPLIFIGTLTPVNSGGQASGPKDSFRICLALLDLKAGLVVGKARQFALPQTINDTPSAFFRDSPVYAKDDATEAYLSGCHKSTLNGPLPAGFKDGLAAEHLIQQAVTAYDDRRYADANKLFSEAAAKPGGGSQVRVLNGLMLTELKLDRPRTAAAAFDTLITYGMSKREFSLSGGQAADGRDTLKDRLPPDWIRQVATRLNSVPSVCVEVAEHSNRPGDSEQTTLTRAQKIVAQLVQAAPELSKRLRAKGAGASEPLIGTGKIDESDALDRRTQFRVVGC